MFLQLKLYNVHHGCSLKYQLELCTGVFVYKLSPKFVYLENQMNGKTGLDTQLK